jgi:glycogen phosphorylase
MATPNQNRTTLAKQEGNYRTIPTVAAFRKALIDNLYYARGQAAYSASQVDIYMALALTVRDYIMDRWRSSVDKYVQTQPKFVYYLSAEYLPGRQINNNLLYSGLTELARQAMSELGFDLDELINDSVEPALGNGGMGRLAACYMDSLATLGIPAVSYGIHYEFGIFKQSFVDGWQVESPDDWLYHGNPWEFPQPDNLVKVKFGGHTERIHQPDGTFRMQWNAAETVMGEPCHFLVPGYRGGVVNMLRLWRARASKEFDFQLFDVGDYARAAEQKIYSENITKVVYPNDNNPQGRELRLKQEYFFASCSLQDIMRRFRSFNGGYEELPDKAVIQLNDTHPAIGIAELMRLLLDEQPVEWARAWAITRRTFAYTNHTLMPEALETWPASLFERVLPRHLEIIYEINQRFLEEVQARFPGDPGRIGRMSIIEEGPERMIRMAYLASVGSFSINGVAELHSRLLHELVLHDFYEMWPEKFVNVTNGVSPRRFIFLSNPRLTELITSAIGERWLSDLDRLQELEPLASQARFYNAWRSVKRANKEQLAQYVEQNLGIQINPDSMFDVLVKRLHEYKRQQLKALHIVALYQRIKANPDLDIVPRTFIFGAKAAPGYHKAKLIIKLINSIAEVINNDASIGGKLKVVFLPNFNVSLGELIYPAADLSEQISIAGKEASGTGNMKFALNGAVTIGTLDGANVEIRERVGAENFFLFGLKTEEVFERKAQGYIPMQVYQRHAELKAALDAISSGVFSPGQPDLFRAIIDSLLYGDEYMVLEDFPSYLDTQDKVDLAYRDSDAWTRMAILNTARCGFFSSDRAVLEYSEKIWKTTRLSLECD